jgi:hypothetical protein
MHTMEDHVSTFGGRVRRIARITSIWVGRGRRRGIWVTNATLIAGYSTHKEWPGEWAQIACYSWYE